MYCSTLWYQSVLQLLGLCFSVLEYLVVPVCFTVVRIMFQCTGVPCDTSLFDNCLDCVSVYLSTLWYQSVSTLWYQSVWQLLELWFSLPVYLVVSVCLTVVSIVFSLPVCRVVSVYLTVVNIVFQFTCVPCGFSLFDSCQDCVSVYLCTLWY